MSETNEVYLTVDQVAERLGVSRDTIYRWKRQGDFPLARKLSQGTTRWRLSDIVAWESTLEAGLATRLDLTPRSERPNDP